MAFTAVTTNTSMVRVLADALKSLGPGEILEYKTMSLLIKQEIRSCRYLLMKAKALANAESGALFRPVRTVGYIRHRNGEAHAHGAAARRRMMRTGRNAIKVMANAVTLANDVSNDEMLKAHTEVTKIGLAVNLMGGRVAVTPDDIITPQPDAVKSSIFAMAQAGRFKDRKST